MLSKNCKFVSCVRSLFIIILLSILVSLSAFAYPGDCALDFLNISVSAKSASMAQGNYSGLIGPQAIFYNPSLIGPQSGCFLSYQNLFLDTRSQALSLSFKISDKISLGLGCHRFDYGDIVGYDENNQRTFENIEANDQLFRLGVNSTGKTSYGFSLSYYEQKLCDVIGQGFGLSFGLTHDFDFARLSLTSDNIGNRFKIGNSSAPLPTKHSFSALIPLKDFFANLNFDFSYSLAYGYKFSFGVDYIPISKFSFRTGSNTDSLISFGLGYILDDFTLDYAYLPKDKFGDRHFFSLSLQL